ncbi:MAG: hypothetical protein QXF61_11325 [Nitrososphaeria archaeon]
MKAATQTNVIFEVDNKLSRELERLKRKLNAGYELTVKWIPTPQSAISGEVKNNCIIIYEENEEKAIQILRHELLDYLIAKVIEPYQKIANKLIDAVNEEAYQRKEKLVETLCKLML